MEKENKRIRVGQDPIWDANQISKGKQILLGLQHLFAMFGATVLVPILTGLDISTTLFMAGAGTLLFHLATGGKVPAFLGSSFAFLGGYAILAPLGADGMPNIEGLRSANGGIFISGLLFIVIAYLIKLFGVQNIMKFFPPIVTGPIIIAIGIGLAPTAISNASSNWIIALVTMGTVIIFNIWGKGMTKVIPIMLGIIAGYICALLMKEVNFDSIKNAEAFALPFAQDRLMTIDLRGISVMIPISLATLMEHVGDISAISATTGKNYLKEPGLHRTLLGDGLATSFSTAFGGPDMTTYGENVGVMALTKVYAPSIIRLAAIFSIILSFFPVVSGFIRTIPTAVIGGVSIILYGMIASTGVRNLVENQVDFSLSRNMIIAGVIFVSALGFGGEGITIPMFGVNLVLPGIAIAAIIGILLNAILPGNDYIFNVDEPNEVGTGIDFSVRNRESAEDEKLVAEAIEKRELEEAQKVLDQDN